MKVHMEYRRVVEGLVGIRTGPISSFETLKRELDKKVNFVDKIPQCDLMHVHEVVSPAAFAAISGYKPYVVHAHLLPGDLDQKTFTSSIVKEVLWNYLSRLYSGARTVIAVSNHGRECLLDMGISEDRVRVIGNGVNMSEFKFDSDKRGEMREELGLSEDDFVVYSVANVLNRKGVPDFIELASRNPDLKFVWFGGFAPSVYTGFSKKMIKRKTKGLDNIIFTGFVDDIVAAHCCGDVFCFPSIFENHPIVVIEAAACRSTLLLRNIKAYDYLEHDESCLKAEELDDFDNYLKRLVEDDDLRERIAENANHLVREEYSIGKVADEVLSVYEAAISQD